MIERLLNVYFHPFSKAGKLLFETKIGRTLTYIIGGLTVMYVIAIIVYYKSYASTPEQHSFFKGTLLPIALIPSCFFLLTISSYLIEKASESLDEQLQNIRNERLEITQKIENDKELDIFHTIQLSLNQLNEYYAINKGQARSSFRFSIFAIVVGLVTLLTGIWLYYYNHSKIDLLFLTGISGMLLEFIGGAYFFMYKKSLEQVNFFFGQLIKIQDTMLSINLANDISLEEKKIEMHERIIISLLERSLK